MISEWSRPLEALNKAGFHCDFLLNDYKKFSYYAFRCVEGGKNKSYFCKSAHVTAKNMLKTYLPDVYGSWGNGYVSVISGNHDTARIAHTLDESELKLAYTFILTQPGVPFFYYGDEIAMRYLPQVSKEGGYNRTGARTPMQWNSSEKNLGFSTAEREKLYLDVDRSADAPCVEQQLQKQDSLLNTVKALNALRAANDDLLADGELSQVTALDNGTLFYKRGKNTYVAFNPKDKAAVVPLKLGKVLFCIGKATPRGDKTLLSAQTAVVFTK